MAILGVSEGSDLQSDSFATDHLCSFRVCPVHRWRRTPDLCHHVLTHSADICILYHWVPDTPRVPQQRFKFHFDFQKHKPLAPPLPTVPHSPIHLSGMSPIAFPRDVTIRGFVESSYSMGWGEGRCALKQEVSPVALCGLKKKQKQSLKPAAYLERRKGTSKRPSHGSRAPRGRRHSINR